MDDEKKEIIVFITNHLTFGVTTIVAIYKDRSQIEIFFETIKQNLKIKIYILGPTFLNTASFP